MKSNLNLYPQKKIQPFDGMSITAKVWAEAHNYHAQALNAHQHLMHGNGIITGLEVVASEPANSMVFILPGAAVDTAGQVVILTEAVAYDLGQNMEGKLRLLLLHREMKTQAAAQEENNAPAYMQDEFVIVARAEAPDLPYVELARLDRGDVQLPIRDAANFYKPCSNEIDLRFRRPACPPAEEQVMAGVCSLDEPSPAYVNGVIHLAGMVARQTHFHLIAEEAASLDASLLRYGLLFLRLRQTKALDKDQCSALRAFLENGGKLLVEIDQPVTDSEVVALLKPAGIVPERLTASHELFQKPNLFFSQPAGALAAEQCGVWSWGGMVLCTSGGYGSLWSGVAAPEQLTRGAIRDALEWGVNLAGYLLKQE